MWSPAERITQSVVKSHMETSRYSAEELKRLAWTMYSQEETRSYQTKVRKRSQNREQDCWVTVYGRGRRQPPQEGERVDW